MIKSRFGTALTTCYCTCTVLALILLQSCSGATKIESTGHVPRMTRITTETIEEESKQVLNPNTGELEKLPVHKTHTIVTQTPSETIEEEWEYIPNPDTGELEKFLVHKTHTIVTQTPTETIKEEWNYVANPITGEIETFLLHKTHTTVTQTSSVKILESEVENNPSDERTNYGYLILTALSVTILIVNLL